MQGVGLQGCRVAGFRTCRVLGLQFTRVWGAAFRMGFGVEGEGKSYHLERSGERI